MADGGRFRGQREPGAEYFDDVMGDNRTPEIFRTDMGGISEYEDVKTEASPEGLSIVMHCRPPGCGNLRRMVLGWPELFIVAHVPQTNVLPTGWRISDVNHAPCPSLKCNCGAPFEPIVPVDYAYRQVHLALQGGLTSEQALLADPEVRRVMSVMQQNQRPQGGVQLPQRMPPGGFYPQR